MPDRVMGIRSTPPFQEQQEEEAAAAGGECSRWC